MKYGIVGLSFLLLTISAGVNASVATGNASDRHLYPYNKEVFPSQEKIHSNSRVFLFSTPDAGSQTDVFLVDNDSVLKYRELNDYAYINYADKDGKIVDGWIKTAFLKSDNSKVSGLTLADFSLVTKQKQYSLLGKAAPDLDDWIKNQGIQAEEPDSHGFNEGFESWEVAIPGALITTSQANDLVARRIGYEDVYVSEIVFLTNAFETLRGAAVGDSWSSVVEKYGNESKTDPDSQCHYYPYFDMKLSFCVDDKGNVDSIYYQDFPFAR